MRARTGLGIVLGLVTALSAVLGLALVYSLAEEYGAGSFADLNVWVVAPPALLAALAVIAFPHVSSRWRVAVVVGTAVVMVAGGVAADAAGDHAKQDRILQDSRQFRCDGPDEEVRVPAAVNRTWRELPRPAPVYGPMELSLTSCVAAVAGDGQAAFAAYTSAFRRLDGWQVQVDQPEQFVIVRRGVRVTVRWDGAPDGVARVAVAARER